MESVNDLMEEVQTVDCVVIVTNHSCYEYKAILKVANLIVDTRNALGKQEKLDGKVVKL